MEKTYNVNEIKAQIKEKKEELSKLKEPKVVTPAIIATICFFISGIILFISPVVGLITFIPSLIYTGNRLLKIIDYNDLAQEIKKLEKTLDEMSNAVDSKKSKDKKKWFQWFKSRKKKKKDKKEKKNKKLSKKQNKKDENEVKPPLEESIKQVYPENNNSTQETGKDNSSNKENLKTKIDNLKKAKEELISGEYRLTKNEIHQDKVNIKKICDFYGWENTNPYAKQPKIKTK